MIAEFGLICLIIALVSSAILWILPAFLAVFLSSRTFAHGSQSKHLVSLHFVAQWASLVCLMLAFLGNDFSIKYIAEHSNALMPWYYKISATWGGHEGSLLLWACLFSAWLFCVTYSKNIQDVLKQKIVIVLAFIQTSILFIILNSSSPFERLAFIPLDGAELNPLLQDIGLIMHPPVLYTGYVGMAVPFAFAVAVLWQGKVNRSDFVWLKPWVMFAWAMLTMGIAMGSWWAYYELGWGGWWFWDPVENASLLPWLASTALLHALSISIKRNTFVLGTLLFAILTFVFSLLGTFLVRSGVVTSVHAFASDPKRGILILIVLGIIAGCAFLLFAFKGWKLMPAKQINSNAKVNLLLINTILLSMACVVVLLGTLYPIIIDAFGLPSISVGAPYFNAMLVPSTWLLLFFLAYAPIVKWKKNHTPYVKISFVNALFSSVLSMVMAFALTKEFLTKPSLIFTLFLVNYVLFFMIKETIVQYKNNNILRGSKKASASYWSMTIAHIGILVFCVGVSASHSLSVQKDVVLGIQEQTRVLVPTRFYPSVQFKLNKVAEADTNNYHSQFAEFSVFSGKANQADDAIILKPEKRFYISQQSPMTEASISAGFWQDVYITYGAQINSDANNQQWLFRLQVKPFIRWVWLGAILMFIAGLISVVFNLNHRSIKK